MKKKRYLGWTITCIVVCVLFVPLIVFNLILSIKGSIDKEKLPSFLGISPTVVLSGSMSPEFEEKDLIFIWAVDTDTLKAKSDDYAGDIICFYKDEEFITHRIAHIEIVNGEKRFYTAGDYTGDLDDNYILADQIQGIYNGRIKKLGGVVLFLQSPYGLMMTIILLVMLYIAGELLFEIREVKWENKEIRGLMARLCVVLLSQKERKAETDSELQRLREENERLQGLLNNAAPVENEIAVAVVNTDLPEAIDDGKGDSEVIVPVGRRIVALSPDMTPSVNRKPRIKEVQVVDFSDEELPEDMKPYTRAQHLALSRKSKEKVKTLIRHVDEHLYDEDTPSNIKKRQMAELWRKATLPTNTKTLKIVEVKIGQKK